MNLSELSVRRPITVIMMSIMIMALGVISITKLPLVFFPEIDWPNLRVQVDYPSSSPEEVEQDITQPLEDILGTVSQLKSMSSYSSNSGANVSLEFDYNVDMDLKALEVRDKIDQVRNQLPDDIQQIRIRRWQTSQSPVMYFSLAMPGDISELNDLLETVIVPRLERQAGVASVDIRGPDQKEIYVDVNPSLLAAYGLDMFNLTQSIRSSNVDLSTGYAFDKDKKYYLRVVGQFRSIDEIRELPIRGTSLRIRDVADIRYTFPERDEIDRLNGKESISLRIYKASTANVVETCQAVRDELVRMSEAPEFAGMEYRIFRDSSEEILGTLNNLSEGGIYGGLLAVCIIFLFLWKVRSTFVMALSMPISVLFTFAGMYILRITGIVDITINIISLSGLVFAIGMIVDCSIVVLENIFRVKQEEGIGAIEAAIKGSRQVGTAVFASTMTTIIVFVPFVFMSQSSFGIFMRDFGIAVSLALVSSLVVSLTVVPMISSLIYKGEERPKKRLIVWLTDNYGRFMHWTLRWRYGLVLLLIPLLWASFALFQSIERQEMPSVPARELRVNVLMPSNFTMAEMTDLFNRIEAMVESNKQELEVDTYSTEWGKNNRSRNRYRGELDLFFTEEGNKLTPVPELEKALLAKLPQEIGVEYQVGERRHFGHGGGGGVSIELRGDNQDILALYAEKVKERLMGIESISDVTTDLESGDQELHFQVNRDKAEKLGLSSQAIARTISAALSERATTRYQTENGEVDVIVRFEEDRRRTQDDILNLDVATAGGELVPLNTVVQPVYASGPQVIRKENRKRIVTITANTDRQGMMWVMSSVNSILADLKLPAGYSWSFGRSFSRFQQDQEMQTFAIWLALVFIFMVMASLFESWIHPITILFTVPFAITGISIIFWITNTQLDRNAWLGIALLCGLVVNNAIILVDHINSLRRLGNRRLESIIQAGKDRLRPILMTAFSTMFGMVPMILPVIFPDWFGVVSYRARQWSPIALALFGGLTTSTFLTLIVLPLIYTIVDDLREWGLGVIRRAAHLGQKTPPAGESQSPVA